MDRRSQLILYLVLLNYAVATEQDIVHQSDLQIVFMATLTVVAVDVRQLSTSMSKVNASQRVSGSYRLAHPQS